MGELAGIGDLFTGTSNLLSTLFGSSSETTGKTTGTGSQLSTFDSLITGRKTGTEKRFLDIEEEGVDKIIADILGGTGGLAEIFSEQGAAGLYGSSVAAQASGDLVSKLAGEIAKLTAKEVTEYDVTDKAAKTGTELIETEQVSTSQQEEEDEGLFGGWF